MTRYRYFLVDVFTHRAFGGNPLAVFPEASGLDGATMQKLAKELNLSESTFVFPPKTPGHDFRVRIFTPASEMPMAGHPTVGTSYMLARLGMIPTAGSEVTIRLEENVGTIPVRLELDEGRPGLVQMSQPMPVFGPRFEDRAALARLLSLDEADLLPGLPLEVVSTGVPFLFVPLTGLKAIKKISFRLDLWEKLLKDFAASSVFVFTPEAETDQGTVHSRMFAPALGVMEDPATGAASGPLGCYLARYGLAQNQGTAHIVSEQGFEIGRPSFVRIEIEWNGQEFKAVRVGGHCHFMGEGYFELE